MQFTIWKQPKKKKPPKTWERMDQGEIVRSYRQNPTSEQILILADLNACDVKEIKAVLIEAGEIKSPKQRKEDKENLKRKRAVEASCKKQAEREKAQQILFNKKRLRRIEFIILSDPKKQWDLMTEKEILRSYTA